MSNQLLFTCPRNSDCQLCPAGMLEPASFRIMNPQREDYNDLRVCHDCMAKLAGEWLARFITFPPKEV